MSQDDWNRPKSPGADGHLPPAGQGWDDASAPKPLHEVRDDEWGKPASGPSGDWGAQPGPGPGPGQRMPGSGYQQPQHHMTHQPPHHMTATDQPDTNDIVAIVLSVFLPGAGHIMLGQTTKGIVILLATFLTCGIGYILAVVIALDTYMLAMARKKRPVDDWEFFPK